METYGNIKVLLTVGVAHGCVHKELPDKELQGIFYYLKAKVYVSYVQHVISCHTQCVYYKVRSINAVWR